MMPARYYACLYHRLVVVVAVQGSVSQGYQPQIGRVTANRMFIDRGAGAPVQHKVETDTGGEAMGCVRGDDVDADAQAAKGSGYREHNVGRQRMELPPPMAHSLTQALGVGQHEVAIDVAAGVGLPQQRLDGQFRLVTIVGQDTVRNQHHALRLLPAPRPAIDG